MKLKKYNFDHHISPFLINNMDSNNLVISNKISFGKKCIYFLKKMKNFQKNIMTFEKSQQHYQKRI